jgi:TatD DNase family protein
MMFTDTHCHIHESGFYQSDREQVYGRAIDSDTNMICIGTNEAFSRQAVEFVQTHERAWATVGVHPHDVKDGWGDIAHIVSEKPEKLVGIGEIGLDYFYDNSPRDAQIKALEEQLQLAVDYDLPVSFHVRNAFDDFWPIFSNFHSLRGVLHSFTDTVANMERGVSAGLYIGVNGISTFTKDDAQRQMFDAVPLEKMLLETDAPFLTPTPHRGKVNEPAFVRNVAEYHANRRGVELEHLARVTSTNAFTLFSL